MSTVDVLIPTCDRAGALAVTLSSLCAQEFRDFRVVVSDQSEQGDVRRDGSVLAACRVLESHGCPVILLRHLPRRGMAEQRQFLLDQASASWVLCLDDDLIIEPYVLGLLTKLMHRERCGFIGSACIGLSYLHDMRPHEQHVIFWEGPVAPEEVKWGSEAWQRARLHNAANLYHVQRRLRIGADAPRLYRVAWVSSCVLYDAGKLRAAGGFSFWKDLPPNHCGEDVLAQLRVLKVYGGAGVMPSGVYHQELPTRVPDRSVHAERVLGWASEAAGRPQRVST